MAKVHTMNKPAKMALTGAIIYMGLTGLGAAAFIADVRSEPSLSAPGDSFMGFCCAHVLGGAIGLLTWVYAT